MKVHYTESNPVKKEFNALCRKMDNMGYIRAENAKVSKKSEMMILQRKLEQKQKQIDELTGQVKILLQLVKEFKKDGDKNNGAKVS